MKNPSIPQSNHRPLRAFTLVEMLVVIAIMSILVTAGGIGLSGIGGKGVTSGVATAEALFDEARTIAVGQRCSARIMIAKKLKTKPEENLRRIILVSQERDDKGEVVQPVKWVVSSRGTLLPDKTYFSQDFSKTPDGGKLPTESLVLNSLARVTASYEGEYFYYEFNAEGICTTPGASFIVGSGTRSTNEVDSKPRMSSEGRLDFGGFVVWRNGRTSMFRNTSDMALPENVKQF